MTNFANDYQKLFINPIANAEKKTGANIAKNLPVLQAAIDAVAKADISALRDNGTTDTKAFKAALVDWSFLAENQNRTHLYAIRQLVKADITIDAIAEKLAVKPVKSIAGIWGLFKPAKPAVRRPSGSGGNSELSEKTVSALAANIETGLATAVAKIMAANYGNMNSADIDAAIKDIAKAMLKDNDIPLAKYQAFKAAQKKAA